MLSLDTVLSLLFQSVFLFISCCCLTAVARTSSTVLKKSSEGRYSCLVSNLRGKVFSPSPLSMMLVVGFLWVWRSSYILWICQGFLSGIGMKFCQMFFVPQLILSYDVGLVGYIDSFSNIQSALHTLIKHQLVMVYNSFDTVLDLIC